MKSAIGLVAAVFLCASGTASGIVYNFTIDGLQETPPVATPASGTGVVTYNETTNELSWNITFSGLIGSFTAAHFHGPAAPGAGPAGVQVPIPGAASPLIGGPVVITDPQETDLLAGLWYVNIHRSFRPGGEIRGQVVPEPATAGLLAIGGLGCLLRRRARRTT